MPVKDRHFTAAISSDLEKLNKIEALANIGSFQWDATTDKLEWSDQLYRIYGYEPRSVNLTFTFFLSHLEDDSRQEFLGALNTHCRHGKEFQFVEKIIRKDGGRATLLSDIKPVLNEDNELVQVLGVCRDVTELFEKDRLLNKQKQFYEDVLDQLPVVVLVVDSHGNFIHTNDKFQSFFGNGDKLLTHTSQVSRVRKEDVEFLLSKTRESIETGKTVEFERWIHFTDREPRNLKLVKKPLVANHLQSDKVVLTIAIDQTKEVLLSEKLTTNHKRLKVAAEGGGLGIIDWDLESGLIDCNEVYYDLLGLEKTYTPSYESFMEGLLHEEDKQKVIELMEKISTGKIDKYELAYRVKSPRKGLIWLSHRGSVLKQNDRPVRIVAVLQDITYERNFEQRITESNNHLKNIIKSAPGAVFRCIPEPGLSLVMVSDQIKSITGYDPEEFSPKGHVHFEDLISEFDRSNNRRVIERAVNERQPQYQNSVRINTKYNGERWIWIKAQIIQPENDNTTLEGFIVDVTDQVNAEDRIMSATLQAEDNQRQRISEEIHDGLQQTLVSSLMGLQNIADDLREKAPELSKKFDLALNTLKLGVEETRNIAHSIMPKSIEDFGLVKTLDQVTEQLNSNGMTCFTLYENLDGRRLEKKVEVSLYRIFQEAINNIHKHANAGDVVIQLTLSPRSITMNIEDDGEGFDFAKLDQFKNGFGLSSMRSRAGSLSGTVDISSRIDGGTNILVEIPVS